MGAAVALDTAQGSEQGSAPGAPSGLQLEATAGDGEAGGWSEQESNGKGLLASERPSSPQAGAEPLSSFESAAPQVHAADASSGAADSSDIRTGHLRSSASATPEVAAESSSKPAARSLPPEQASAVFKQVRMQLSQGQRQATIHLQPAWLGRVSIRIEVRDGRALAELRAERPESLEALEKHIPELRAALAERGFEQAEFDLGLSDPDAGGAGFGADSGKHPQPVTARLNLPGVLAGDDAPASASPEPSITDLGVDTYA